MAAAGVREASGVAVAEPLCQPSEFLHRATPLFSDALPLRKLALAAHCGNGSFRLRAGNPVRKTAYRSKNIYRRIVIRLCKLSVKNDMTIQNTSGSIRYGFIEIVTVYKNCIQPSY